MDIMTREDKKEVKAVILYHSSTGNTQFGAEIIQRQIQKEGGQCELIKISQVSTEALEKFDLIGVASPVYSLQPAPNVTEYLSQLPSLRDKYGFAFITYGMYPANSLAILTQLLQAKGISLLGVHAMRAEEAFTPIRFSGFIPSMGRPTDYDALLVRNFATEIIQRYTMATEGRDIARGITLSRSPYLDTITRFLNKDMMRRMMGRVVVDQTRCVQCGKCASNCPTQAIELKPFPTLDSNRCMGCWGCINICPYDAIESPLARNRVRYKGIREYRKMQIEDYLARVP
jgi:ferredoxin/flavodoxin